jgi:hypothetical protein
LERAADIGSVELRAAAGAARGRGRSDGSRSRGASATTFALVALALVSASAIFAGWMPLRASIVTVFLFAGPHNWFELRYFLARLPARLGRSRSFFVVAFTGIASLLAAYALLPTLARVWLWNDGAWTLAVGVWNSLLVLWLAALVWMRGRQSARRDWSWSFAAACALIAVNWLAPHLFSLSLVYLHPLVALWFLDRVLRRDARAAHWRRAYHLCATLRATCSSPRTSFSKRFITACGCSRCRSPERSEGAARRGVSSRCRAPFVSRDASGRA